MSAHGAPPIALSVVIPCLNEARTIGACVAEARQGLAEAGLSDRGEVLVVDNGSEDASVALAEAAGARVVACAERGYGAALRAGFEAAHGAAVLMGDGDGSYDFREIPRFYALFRQGARLVLGDRLGGTIAPGAMPAAHRYLGTPVLTGLFNRLYDAQISDCNCGMRLVERRTLRTLDLRASGMELASEMLVKARLQSVPIVELPITLRRDGRDRPPHLRPWRDGMRHLRVLLVHLGDR